MGTAKKFQVNGRWIGDGCPAFIIGEIGANHDHDKRALFALIDACAAAKVDAVKFQTFTGLEVTHAEVPADWYPVDNPRKFPYWYQWLDSIAMPKAWYPEAFAYVREKGMIPFSTPSGMESAWFLQALGVPLFKMQSMDINNTPFYAELGALGKPILFSIGMGMPEEISAAVAALRGAGCSDFVITHCVANYPAKPEELNLRMLTRLRERFDALVGLSDHSLQNEAAAAAVALGACIVEKHVTLGRNRPGPDHPFALEPAEVADLVARIREVDAAKKSRSPEDILKSLLRSDAVQQALGDGESRLTDKERKNRRILLRSICSLTRIPKGAPITRDLLTIVNPFTGIAPGDLPTVLAKRAAVEIPPNTPLQWEMLA